MRALIWLMTAGMVMAQQRPVVTLEGSAARVTVDRLGGSIVTFEFKSGALNPLGWNNANAGLEKRPMSHFLCLDRWGQVSEAEGKSGMPFHGEATRVEWQAQTNGLESRMTTHLPIAKFDVSRTVKMHPSEALFTVSEAVTNRNPLGRPYNMVQHPTIAPPFLDASTVVDANARAGFMQSSPLPNPEHPTVYWPQALKDGQPVNLRHLTNDPLPNVVSFVVEDKIGWVTAATASKGLLIGYVWKTSDYPWLNIWRHVDGASKPMARGLEFGTTGLHQPFQALLQKGRMFGRPVVSWLEPGETQSRSYAAFLLKIPADFQGVASLTVENGTIQITERESNRKYSVNGGALLRQ